MAQGLINNGVLVTKNFTPNELELLVDYTVSGSAISSYTFNGLKINADEEVILVTSYKRLSGSASGTLEIYVNENTTKSNYYCQGLSASSTNITSSRLNLSILTFASSGQESYSCANIKLTNNGFFTVQSFTTQDFGSSIVIENNFSSSTFTTSSISSIKIQNTSSAVSIDVGSRFQLYKVKGQVQQTWATT